MIKGSMYQEDITNLNVYVANHRAAKYKYIKQKKAERETNKSTIVVDHASTPVSASYCCYNKIPKI